jgi:hypothetical protein
VQAKTFLGRRRFASRLLRPLLRVGYPRRQARAPRAPRGSIDPEILTRPPAALALIFNDNVTEKRSAREKSREHHYDQMPEPGRGDFDRHRGRRL